MGHGRFLKYTNIVIGFVFLAAAGVAYWFLLRPLPETSGRLTAPVNGAVSVRFDSLGVPHILGETEEDVWFVQGFVTAQERMWQMDALRRSAGGELSEIAGVVAFEADRDARALRLRRLAEAAEQTLLARERRAFAAYARGVNFYLESNRDRLPVEFRLAGYRPRPWRMADSAIIGFYMLRTLTSQWKSDLRKGRMLEAGNRDLVERLWPPRSGGGAYPGSNAWVVSGAWTASGRPLLANDMHLELSIPNAWFLAHLETRGDAPLNVSGVTLPGLPGVIVGHNDQIAWGITNLEFDVQDLYRERIDPVSGRYQAGAGAEQARAEREIILIKDSRPAELLTWITRHGPLIVSSGKDQYSVRWAVGDPRLFTYVFPDVNRARNWTEFRAALSRMPGPSSNFVYADAEGNIGYQVAGTLPIRKGFSGSAPLDAVSGGQEWSGFIPFEALPSLFNPPSGMIVTANQNPFPKDFPYAVDGNFAPPDRAHQIRAMLAARKGWKPRDMLVIQKDVYSAFGHFMARELVAAYDRSKRTDPLLAPVVSLLRAWDGQMEMDRPEPLVVTLVTRHLRRSLAEIAAPGQEYESAYASTVIESLLRERPAAFFTDWDKALLDEFAGAVAEARRMQGRDPRKWRWGRFNQRAIQHPIGHQIPWIGAWWDLGTIQFSGSPTTARQITGLIMPSMRMVADPGDWDRSLISLPIGQSGHVASSHYKDQWKTYYVGESFPMPFYRIRPSDTLLMEPVRQPGKRGKANKGRAATN